MTVLGCLLLPVCVLLLLPLSWLEMGGRWKGVLLVTLCAFLLAYGWFAFFAQLGGLSFVGESFEWPVVWTGGAVENDRGERFVPVAAAGRVQVYNRESEFVRGWFVPSSGGGFKLHVTEDDKLEVFTVRGDRCLVYAADGTLVSDGEYREDYRRLPTGPACRVDRVSPWYLWPMANPILAVLPGFAGLAGLGAMFTSKTLRVAQMRRALSRRPRTVVPSDELGRFSIDVDMLHEPPYGVIDSDDVHTPPAGAWFQQEPHGFSVGASTRSPVSLWYVPFVVVFSVGTLGWNFGRQVVSGEFHLGTSLFGVPFAFLSIVFWTIALMAVCDKIVVKVNNNEGTIFVGIGPLGWTRSFDWSAVTAIRQEGACTHYLGADNGGILLEGTTPLQFGTNLTEQRRCFLLNALQYLRHRAVNMGPPST